MNSTDYLDPFADPTLYNINGNTDYQTTIDFFAGSWNATSVATGNGWNINTVLDPNAVSGNANCQSGETPLACEIRLRNPAVIIVSFQPNNVVGVTDYDTFRTKLQEVVDVSKASGVIPVLATLPNDNATSLSEINAYNQIIVEVAEANKVPVWNLYLTLDNTPGGIYSVGGTGAGDLSADGGYNRRNRATLDILTALRTKVFQ
jgi:hypothetical protein